MKKGLFIVFYGINNLGKSTQAKLLVELLNKEGQRAEYLKYALYELPPSGPVINGYLREGNPYQLTPREFQLVQIINKDQYEPILVKKLEQGITVVAEDYFGTTLAWGIGAGVEENFLKKMGSHLLKEDMAFLFEGKRFATGIEQGHKHESDDQLTEKVRLVHDKLADEFGWIRIDANRPIEEIAEEIWRIIKKKLSIE
jgi:dTMP kinase